MQSIYTKRANVLSFLRGEQGDLARYMRPGNSYVDIKLVDTMGLTPAHLVCNEIEIRDMDVMYVGSKTPVTVTFIRATYGHKGDVLSRMLYGTYVPYNGPHDIFCITHFSVYGLGDINHNRTLNMLSTPDITQNKGVVAYVSIAEARVRGFEFWSRIGDRFQNKVVCFDPDLKLCFHNLKYIESYCSDESLLRTHAGAIMSYSRFMSPAKAFEQVKRLIFTEESEDEDLEFGTQADDEYEEAPKKFELAELLQVLTV